MNYAEACQMRDAFAKTGGFSKIEIEHFGFLAERTSESEMDGKWEVHLRTINPKTGNRSLEVVKEYTLELVPAIARKAAGKATAKDKEVFARMAAERTVNQS